MPPTSRREFSASVLIIKSIFPEPSFTSPLLKKFWLSVIEADERDQVTVSVAVKVWTVDEFSLMDLVLVESPPIHDGPVIENEDEKLSLIFNF